MLAPIPASILRHTVTLKVCTGIDEYSTPTYGKTQTLERVCMQSAYITRRSKDNTEVVFRAICFVDARLSRPQGVDIDALNAESHAGGSDMLLEYDGRAYTVISVEGVCDDTGKLHHYELGLGATRGEI